MNVSTRTLLLVSCALCAELARGGEEEMFLFETPDTRWTFQVGKLCVSGFCELHGSDAVAGYLYRYRGGERRQVAFEISGCVKGEGHGVLADGEKGEMLYWREGGQTDIDRLAHIFCQAYVDSPAHKSEHPSR